MPTIGLNHYNLRAAPELLAELKEFYCEVVGLELGKRMPAMSSG
ncbi:MAG: diguanylate cyclase, partial [Nitrosospira sp.]|nr:diguanylate cyclase [Nitrosospira sp.]